MSLGRTFAIVCSLGWTAACYQTPPIPSSDFANSVLILSSPNLVGGNPLGVSVLLQRGSGAHVTGSVVQVQADQCDVTQPTAPTDGLGMTDGSVVSAPVGEHVVNATVTVGAEQITVPATTTLNVVPVVASDANAVQAGTPLNMQAVALLSSGEVNTAFSGITHFVSSDPNATLPQDAPMPASYHGVEIWPGSIILRSSGTQTVQIVDTVSGALLANEEFTVVPGPIGKLSFINVPTNVVAGVPFNATLAAETPSGGVLQSYTGTVSFSSSDTHGSVPASVSYAPADAGTKTFTFTLTHAGAQQLQVTDGIVVATVLVNVVPGPVASFSVSGIPSPATALTPYSASISAVDSFGNPATNFTGTITLSCSDPNATVPASISFASGSSTYPLTGLVFRAYGTVTLTATSAAAQNVTGTQQFTVHRIMALSHQSGESTGQGRICVLIDGGQVKCFGDNSNGALGYGDATARGDTTAAMGAALPYVSLGTGRTALKIASGASHTCAILDNNGLKCWGNNLDGELGLGDTQIRGNGPNTMGDVLPYVFLGANRTAVQAAVGSRHTCVLLDDGTVKCWGHNDVGELGYGDSVVRGPTVASMQTLPTLSLGTGRTATQLFAGSFHNCALLDNQQVKCWGWNAYAQLGVGDTTNRGATPNTMGDSLPNVQLGTGAVPTEVRGGEQHTCVLLADHGVKCWGYNNDGELGLGDNVQRGGSSVTMGDNLPEINLGTNGAVVGLSASYYSSCALLQNGTVKCWGYNATGQLGVGDLSNRGAGATDMGNALPSVNLGTLRTALQLGSAVTNFCALLDEGFVRCWGDNSFGQLGTGTPASVGASPSQLGDSMLPALLW